MCLSLSLSLHLHQLSSIEEITRWIEESYSELQSRSELNWIVDRTILIDYGRSWNGNSAAVEKRIFLKAFPPACPKENSSLLLSTRTSSLREFNVDQRKKRDEKISARSSSLSCCLIRFHEIDILCWFLLVIIGREQLWFFTGLTASSLALFSKYCTNLSSQVINDVLFLINCRQITNEAVGLNGRWLCTGYFFLSGRDSVR